MSSGNDDAVSLCAVGCDVELDLVGPSAANWGVKCTVAEARDDELHLNALPVT